MRSQENNPAFESLESGLSELSELERAGVFQRTPAEAERLLRAYPAAGMFRLCRTARGWIAAAAIFFVAATTSSLLFYREFGEMRERLSYSANGRPGELEGTLACVGGPTTRLPSTCLPYDFDADGDVDMADFSRQLTHEAQR